MSIVNTAPTTNTHVPSEEYPVTNRDEMNRVVKAIRARRQATHMELCERVAGMTANLDAGIRGTIAKFLLDGARDINAECGYPDVLTPQHYQAMYEREGAAKRVVAVEPKETWAMPPTLYEDEDPDNLTPFEAKWKELEEAHNLWAELLRIDILSGIGQYGVLFLGVADGEQDLSKPVAGVNPDGTYEEGLGYDLLFVRPFQEYSCFVSGREVDPTNRRFGQPTMYNIHFADYPQWGIGSTEIVTRRVHWSRVIHVADNREQSQIYGTPRMKDVYNRLVDLRKVYAGSGEAYWKGGFPGIAFEVDPEVADQGIDLDKDTLREEMEAYMNGLQRYLAITGVKAKTLPPIIADPDKTIRAYLENIALTKGIPYRTLFGSEEGKLASSQDSRTWNKRLALRQKTYVVPYIIKPFVDRLIGLGALPAPKIPYRVDWEDLNSPTDQDKATTALTQTQAMQTYVSGGVAQLIPPDIYLTEIIGLSKEMKDEIKERMTGTAVDGALDAGEGDPAAPGLWQGGMGAIQGQSGNILDEGNLAGSTTGGQGYPRDTAQLYTQPGMNEAGSE